MRVLSKRYLVIKEPAAQFLLFGSLQVELFNGSQDDNLSNNHSPMLPSRFIF